MFGRLLLISVFLQLSPFWARATDQLYVNNGIVTNAQVDAFNFVNNGQFLVGTLTVPWDSQNTRTFTNHGTMSGSVGFRLENVSPTFGMRSPADVIFNNGTIEGLDAGGLFGFFNTGGGGTSFIFTQDSSYVTLNARTIANHGNVFTGPSGNIHVNGESVDLTGGTLIVNPVGTASQFSLFSSFFITPTNFFPDPGVYDISWGQDINTNVNISRILTSVDPTTINSTFFRLTNDFGACGGSSLSFSDAQTWVYESAPSPTNVTVQVVAVQMPAGSANINAKVGFLDAFTFPDSDPPVPGTVTPVIEFSSIATNLISDRPFTNTLYVIDQLASQTNTTLLVNLAAGTFRPAPIIISRSFPYKDLLLNANSSIRSDIFSDPLFTNRVVTNFYDVYAASVESTASRLPALPDVGVTNAPGRVEVQATGALNLRNARIRGEGLVSIKSTNFIGSSDAVIDSPHFNYSLANSAPVRMQNLAPEFVARFGGPLFVYDSIWTNTLVPLDTNQPSIEYKFHLVMVDASDLHSTERALVHELTLRSPTSVDIDDSFSVANQLLLDAPTVSINNHLRLEPGVVWEPARFSTSVRNLIISPGAELEAFELAQYGRPTEDPFNPAPLDSLINQGTLQAFSHVIDTLDFQNTGSIIATNVQVSFFTNDCTGQIIDFSTNFFSTAPSGPIEIHARQQARMDGGQIISDMNVRLFGPVFKLFNNRIQSGGTLILDVDGTLTDAGENSGNVWTTTNGISMSAARPVGNLLGTAINSWGNPFAVVEHFWSAADLGPSTNVYSSSNNLAVGILRLNGGRSTDFEFHGTDSGSHALYVDLLEINGDFVNTLKNFTNSIVIDQNFTIYYAELRTTNSTINTETVNGLRFFGGGKMVWVPFAGPNTSVDVPISPTRSIRVNRALRFSLRIDSDGDGIPNGLDPTPFGTSSALAAQVSMKPGGLEIRFSAEAQTGYTIEYTDELTNPDWKVLRQVTNSEAVAVEQVITNFVDNPQRYFRISSP